MPSDDVQDLFIFKLLFSFAHVCIIFQLVYAENVCTDLFTVDVFVWTFFFMQSSNILFHKPAKEYFRKNDDNAFTNSVFNP